MSKPLPPHFTPVAVALPENDRPVLVIREAGYVSAKFEVLTARYQPDYRPRNPWCTISNDAVTDSGSEVLGWAEADAWLQA